MSSRVSAALPPSGDPGTPPSLGRRRDQPSHVLVTPRKLLLLASTTVATSVVLVFGWRPSPVSGNTTSVHHSSESCPVRLPSPPECRCTHLRGSRESQSPSLSPSSNVQGVVIGAPRRSVTELRRGRPLAHRDPNARTTAPGRFASDIARRIRSALLTRKPLARADRPPPQLFEGPSGSGSPDVSQMMRPSSILSTSVRASRGR